ncbi:hypothetical protein ACJIZ3_011567 [Penstemon smallii]|uniref:Uncharacterized protein n=1 Tax=Penstemon smallii TaxID=265156 RepID=A0ABD3UN30_9LAMI
MKNSFIIPLKTHSNFKALCVKTDFSPWNDLKSKKNQFEILAKRLVISFGRLRSPAAGAITFGFLMSPNFTILYASWYFVAVMLGLGSLFAITFKGAVDSRNSVYKLHVEVLDLKKSCSLKKDLKCIVETADTSTAEGLKHKLTEATLALLRNSYCVTEATCVHETRRTDTVEKRFKQLVFEESEKYSKLGTSNTGIVTILVAAKGVPFYLPCIKYTKHLKESLLKLATIPSSTILG